MKKKIKKMSKKTKKKIIKKKISKPIVKEEEVVRKTKVRVIGIGGGGGSIVSEIVSRIKKADFIIANTDLKALNSIKQAKKFQFGQNATKGLGTGMNVEVGEAAAEEDKDKIKKLFEGQDICIIVSCLGGGAGSGASPIFAKLSKSMNCITYGIFTMPFSFEGERKMEIAEQALEKIKPHLNAFSVIPNERIFTIIDKNTALKEALSAINERLAKNLEGLIEMIYLPGLINIDFADVKTVLSGRGKLCYLSTIELSEQEREEAVKKVISSPLYTYTIKGAKGIIYNIVGAKTLQLSEVSKLSKIIADSVNKKAKIIFGISQNEKYSNKIKITLLASGCAIKGVINSKKPRIIKKARSLFRKPEIIEKKVEEKIEQKIGRKPIEKPIEKSKLVMKKSVKNPPVGEVKKKLARKITKKNIKKKPEKKIIREEITEPIIKKEEVENFGDVKLRRNALQVRKVVEEEERELMEKENVWETPAIFRRKK
jgi:cell division protein FtsZ